ncbi:MAG: hypothetical protein DRN96_02795 [Thermoproteota archaeon]|nr:MAG: hypothetical protein DRN96_02795 [Candidatus Korarchaeota archaeon]RLG55455.1 MAG: hypothetical protein DRN99_02625 [Candidatus Korarchaeota archaeon]
MKIRLLGGWYQPDLGPPAEAHLELTSKCNLSCRFCYRRSWSEELGEMELQHLKAALRELHEAGVKVLWLSGYGEPTYYTHFQEAVDQASRWFKLGLVTNGTMLEEYSKLIAEKIRWVVVSIESFTSLYQELREGASLAKVREGMRSIMEAASSAGRTPAIWISMILMKSNLSELPSSIEEASKSGAIGVILSNLIPTSEAMASQVLYGSDPDSKVHEVLHEARRKAIVHNLRIVEPEFKYRTGTGRYCPFIENNALVVNWDTSVSPCLMLSHTYGMWLDGRRRTVKRAAFGSIAEKPLKDIWSTESYVKFRVLVKLGQFPSCNDCQHEEYCAFFETTEHDCWGNSPSCASCLYYRRIVQCPMRYLVEHVRLIREYP